MSARRKWVGILGTIVGLTGVEHGVGALLQGWKAPPGVVFPSWPHSALFRILDGEPAMSVVPNLALTGVLAIAASLAFVAWATVLADRERAGLALLGLSVVMLLVGAGFGPPFLGVVIGLGAMGLRSPLRWWRSHPEADRAVAGFWPLSLVACALALLALSPGIPMLSQFVAVDGMAVIPPVFATVMLLMLASILASQAYDARSASRGPRGA